MPPSYNRYVAWGFADLSLRIGNYESDKAAFVSESVVQNNGEILACVCPSPKLIVTAGTSTVSSHVLFYLSNLHISTVFDSFYQKMGIH